jgi:hypothetical protein
MAVTTKKMRTMTEDYEVLVLEAGRAIHMLTCLDDDKSELTKKFGVGCLHKVVLTDLECVQANAAFQVMMGALAR